MYQQMILEMLKLQETVNTRVNPEWMTAANPWHRAGYVESVEMLDHWGWAWWKSQPHDIEQVQLELVDIWHFLLSSYIEKMPLDEVAKLINPENVETAQYDNFGDMADYFIGCLAKDKVFHVPTFYALMDTAGLTFECLYLHYVGKSALNKFRQDHGYKEGTYIKIWNGREDNEHLFDMLKQVDPKSIAPGYGAEIYARIDKIYSELEKAA